MKTIYVSIGRRGTNGFPFLVAVPDATSKEDFQTSVYNAINWQVQPVKEVSNEAFQTAVGNNQLFILVQDKPGTVNLNALTCANTSPDPKTTKFDASYEYERFLEHMGWT